MDHRRQLFRRFHLLGLLAAVHYVTRLPTAQRPEGTDGRWAPLTANLSGGDGRREINVGAARPFLVELLGPPFGQFAPKLNLGVTTRSLHIFPDAWERVCTFALMSHSQLGGQGKCVPSSDYYLRQSELAARLVLAEPSPDKARALQMLALEYYDKAEKAKVEEARPKAG